MTGRPSQKDLDADRNGRGHGQESARDSLGPNGSQTGQIREAAGEKQASMDEAIDRATAAVGQDDGKR